MYLWGTRTGLWGNKNSPLSFEDANTILFLKVHDEHLGVQFLLLYRMCMCIKPLFYRKTKVLCFNPGLGGKDWFLTLNRSDLVYQKNAQVLEMEIPEFEYVKVYRWSIAHLDSILKASYSN